MIDLARFRSSNPLIGRLFRGAAWGVFGAVFTRLLALLLSVAIARILQTERFGQFLIIQNTLGMFGVFAGLGLGVVATKFAAELHHRDAERLGRILGLVQIVALFGSVAIAFVLAMLAPVIATHGFHRTELTPYVRIVAATVVFLTLEGCNTATLFGLEHIKQSVQGTLLSASLSLPVALLLTSQFGLEGAVYGVLLSSIMQWVVSHVVLSRALRERGVAYRWHTRAEWEVLRQYAVPSLLGGIMVVPVHWLCQVMLATSPRGMVEVAVMGIGLQWFQLVFFLPIALSRVMLPIMTDIIASGESPHSKTILKASILANAAASLPVALAVSVMSSTIMRVYDVHVAGAALSLTLMVSASTIAAICSPVGQVMVAKGQIWYGWFMNVGWAIVYLGLSRMLLDRGAAGIAASLLAAYLAHSIWVCVWTWNSLRTTSINRF